MDISNITLITPPPEASHEQVLSYFKYWIHQNGGLHLASRLLGAGEDGPGNRRFIIDPSTTAPGQWCWWDSHSATESTAFLSPNEAAIEAAAMLIDCGLDLDELKRPTWDFSSLLAAVGKCCTPDRSPSPSNAGLQIGGNEE